MVQGYPAALTTDRLHLRCASTADPVELAKGINDFEVLRWLTRAPYPYALADAEGFVQRRRDEPKPVWAIHDNDGLAGVIGFDKDLGYWLARHAWGKGYATEVGRAVLRVRFEDPDITEVHSSYFEGNDASARVLRKLGFRDNGPCLLPSMSNGRDMVARKMRLSRADWQDGQR